MLMPIQDTLLRMLKWFHEFCVNHNITYYAIGGTMLGAARHNGFIPWDDDIDIGVPRPSYEKLIELLKSPVDGYFLETPYSGNDDYLYAFSKLYDTNTTLVEQLRTPFKRGIYCDIYPLDGIGNSWEDAQKNFRRFKKMNVFLMLRICTIEKRRIWYKNLVVISGGWIIEKLIGGKRLSMSVADFARKINSDESAYIANLMGRYGNREICKREYFGVPTLYPFEDIQLYGPEKYDEYLTTIYGDWRKLPPEDKRHTKHNFIEMDLEKPYV